LFEKQLNDLVEAADVRLLRIHSRINVCKTNLLILERKLSSVPDLEGAVVAQTPIPSTVEDTQTECLQETQSNSPSNDVSEPSQSSNDMKEEEEQESQASEVNPELIRFHRMLKVGVPLPAVRQKMMSEGFDPDLLKP